MQDRITAETALLKSAFPVLEFGDDFWCRFADYVLPDGIWSFERVELAFQIPAQLPGQQPYGFWVRPSIRLANGAVPGNYSENVSIPLGNGWGQFSWAPEVWAPAADMNEITKGSNMVNFVNSFTTRLGEAS